jgi:hypothetical protein
MKMSLKFLCLLLALASTALPVPQNPSVEEGDSSGKKGYDLRAPDVDSVSDLHGNPSDAKLVIFSVTTVLWSAATDRGFEPHHPELRYITVPVRPWLMLLTKMAAEWLAFFKSQQAIYHKHGFCPIRHSSN